MTCPNCGYKLYCGCKSRAPRNPPGVKTYRDTEDGEGYICGYCGFAASCDWWLDWDMQGLYFIEALKAVGIEMIFI